jgi:hypothetical protein
MRLSKEEINKRRRERYRTDKDYREKQLERAKRNSEKYNERRRVRYQQEHPNTVPRGPMQKQKLSPEQRRLRDNAYARKWRRSPKGIEAYLRRYPNRKVVGIGHYETYVKIVTSKQKYVAEM